MILTKRDKGILKFIEEFGSITINQCSKIFFKDCKRNYYQARRRLKLLSDSGYLKRFRKDMRSESVYYLEKRLSVHDLKVLDVYAEFINLGTKIKCFKQEYVIPTGEKNYRADAVIEFDYKGYWNTILIEVDYTHFTSQKKLIDIYNSNYFQEKYKKYDDDIFPTVIILRPFLSNNLFKSELFSIVYMDFYSFDLNLVLS